MREKFLDLKSELGATDATPTINLKLTNTKLWCFTQTGENVKFLF